MMFAPGCRWMLRITAGVVVHPGRLLHVLDAVDHVGDVGQRTGAPLLIGDDQRLIVVAGQQLVVGADRVGLLRAVEVALGLVDVGAARAPCAGPRGSGRSDASAVGLTWTRTAGFCPPLMLTSPTPEQLRDLLRQPRVGEVLDLSTAAASFEVSASVRIGASAGLVLL